MNIQTYSSEQWSNIAEEMHFNVFNEHRPKELNRIDFALVVWSDEVPMGYVTCKEYDSESIYIGYGGAMEHQRKNYYNVRAYCMILEALSKKYHRANTLIENTNTAMLKMAMACGFNITGLRVFKGSILLENSIEWSK